MRTLPTLAEFLAEFGPMYGPQVGSAPRPRNVPKLPGHVEDVHPLDIENAMRRAGLSPHNDYHLGILTNGITMVLSFSGEWKEKAARGMAEVAKIKGARPVQADDWGREFHIPKWNNVGEGAECLVESLKGLKFKAADASDDNGTKSLFASLTKEQAAEIIKQFNLVFWAGNTKHAKPASNGTYDVDFREYARSPQGSVVFGYGGALFVQSEGDGKYSCEINTMGGNYPELRKLEAMIGDKLPPTE